MRFKIETRPRAKRATSGNGFLQRGLALSLLIVTITVVPVPRGVAGDPQVSDQVRGLIEDLRAEKVDIRRAAANALHESRRSVQLQALPALIERLDKEKDGQVRLAALDVVTALGIEATPAIPALVKALRTNYGGNGQEESHQDYRAAMALAAIGKPAVQPLLQLLKEKKISVRAEVIMALGRIEADAGVAVPELIPLLSDKNDRIATEASQSLGRIGPASIPALVAVTRGTDGKAVVGALKALGSMKVPDSRAREAVLGFVKDANPLVRAAAIQALPAVGLTPEATLPILAENLRHENETVRLAVVSVVVERPSLLKTLAPELEKLLSDRSTAIAHHAAFLLAALGPEATPRLINALHNQKSPIAPIADALSQIGRPATSLLMKALGDSEPRVRQGAALALGKIRPLPPGVVEKLTAGLSDRNPDVKAAFLSALTDLGPRATDSVSVVRGLLNDPSAEVRIQAISILYQAAPRNDALVTDLTSRLNDPDASVQQRALDTIRLLGPLGSKALPVAVTMLENPSAPVRLAAVELIGSHGSSAPEALPALTRLLDDASPHVRISAAQTLAKFGKAAQPALSRLSQLVVAEPAELREAVVYALVGLELDTQAIRPPLAKALRDPKSEVRRAAMRAIQRLGPQGSIFLPDIILLAEQKENMRSVERMLRRFEARGPDPRSLPELVNHLGHKQASVRLLAIKYLAIAGPNAKDALPALERMREDPSSEVRSQAAAAAKRIQGSAGKKRLDDQA